jgi:mono/diheme cytochrome c family protein
MKTIVGLIIVLALLVTGGLAFIYSGTYNVAATAKDSKVIDWMVETTRKNSILARSENIVVPAHTDERSIAAGGKEFDQMCAYCHGAPGKKPFEAAGDMNPSPPDLGEVVPKRTPAALFWVIKHGIRMTGMPAWGPTHSDERLWRLVAFLQRLPELSPESYKQLIANAPDIGHEHAHNQGSSTAADHHDEGDTTHSH